ncbi:hypothetical protein CIRG_00539 [Coccidioides immitis RMSCC 2394]|uniref:Uncharacterized protein n=1 Tax=Coccidioides immitis RMSCC 2394 TaxID=404692 RepID=A0A0J7ASY7_COCIT|nr:hypothetical protein CIRG_00539 [Coccidioides immitis RMSCC 2394]
MAVTTTNSVFWTASHLPSSSKPRAQAPRSNVSMSLYFRAASQTRISPPGPGSPLSAKRRQGCTLFVPMVLRGVEDADLLQHLGHSSVKGLIALALLLELMLHWRI